MRHHSGKNHIEDRWKRDRPAKTGKPVALRWKPVCCQRLFLSGPNSQYFEVSPQERTKNEETLRREGMAKMMSGADYIRTQIDEAIEESDQEIKAQAAIIFDDATQTEVSP